MARRSNWEGFIKVCPIHGEVSKDEIVPGYAGKATGRKGRKPPARRKTG